VNVALALVAALPFRRDNIQGLTWSIVERMKSEKNSFALASLGSALGTLSGKLEAKDVLPGAAIIVERMKSEPDANAFAALVAAWTELEPLAYRELSSGQRSQACIDSLQHPLAVKEAREEILKRASAITGRDFHEDLREFVDWATSSEGRKLRLRVEPRPYVRSAMSP
jgi:hypothetical protein